MDFRKMVPWRGRERLREARESFRGFVEPMGRLAERALTRVGAPRAEIAQTPTHIVVRAHLPGFKREELSVEATEGALILRGGLERGAETRRHGLLRRRRESRAFFRRIPLPAAVKPEGAAASFKDETLEVRLPRVKELVVRRVEIS